MARSQTFITSVLAVLVALRALHAVAASTPSWPLQSFKTVPFQVPTFNVTKRGHTEPGYLFLSPSDSALQNGAPRIVSDDGQLVWQGQNGNTTTFRTQMLDGEPVLTIWDGYLGNAGFGYGSISILNSSYDEIYKVTLGPEQGEIFNTGFGDGAFSSFIDPHEDQITSEGTILVTAVNTTQADLRAVGGPEDGWVQDGLFYEIDIKTNEVLFRWSTHENVAQVPITYSRVSLGELGYNNSAPWGYPHINAVTKYGDFYLLSSRYMCSVFWINKNGTVAWRLGGHDGGDFSLAMGTQFCYQHEPRLSRQTEDMVTLHLHNNDNSPYFSGTSATTGLTLDLYLNTSTVELNSKVWDSSNLVFAVSMGGYHILENGHVLMGHGTTPVVEEFDENGSCVMSMRFGEDLLGSTYRAYRQEWHGMPGTKPAVVACRQQMQTVVYVSWNGATDVTSWKISLGSDPENLTVAKEMTKNGFETKTAIDSVDEYVMVEAIGGPQSGTKSDAVMVEENCSM